MRYHAKAVAFALVLLPIAACQPTASVQMDAATVEADLQRQLIEAEPGTEIILPEGTFQFARSLSLNDTPGITLRGAGKGKTVLSFENQVEGAEGLLVKSVSDITLEGFSVVDSKGDAIKVQASENVILRDLETTWTGGQLPTNGGYGLYPVSSTNVLVEDCEASYASDAGIYVGQSTNVVVRNNYVHHNVAGLEIENTINGEVYDNLARYNTGGMLIFDMPDLPQPNGDRIKFYNNRMEENNSENFAPKGSVVATIPPGSGMIIMAHSNIEAYDNAIVDHKTVGIAINSWLLTGLPFESDAFDPFSTNIHIHDNEIITGSGPTDMSTEFGQLISAMSGGAPLDIAIDGIFSPAAVSAEGMPQGFCFQNNGEGMNFLNLNAGMNPDPMAMMVNKSADATPFDCSLPSFDTSDHDQWLAE
ncbi:MAG: hypothetical protein HKN29_03025 [Rhodothermales bacterium]|nr:hypothetical protein [Rhodothermales bacterium]